MNLDLSGKNALVCGSSKGIGKAAAIEIAKLGANVTLVSRSAEVMADIAKELDTSGGQKHDFLMANFSNSTDLKKKVRGLVSGKAIHILVNNTGGPPSGPIMEAREMEFTQAFHNHLICNHLLTTIVTPRMIREGYGRIINVISTSVKAPIPGLGVSNTVRAAVANWSKTMASELGKHGITVNNVLPGSTWTDRIREIIQARAAKLNKTEAEIQIAMEKEIPLGRFAQAEEVGAAIAFLASPAAAYINGINLPVDGGRTKSL